MGIVKNVSKIVFFCLLVLLCWSAFSGYRQKRAYEATIRDLSVRLAASAERIEVRYVHDTIPVYETKIVEVDRTDYKKQLADRELIQELGFRVSQLESENRQLLSTRDTVVLEPLSDSLFTYRDHWSYFSYDLSTRELGWEVRDSISTFVSRDYKHKFLWWKWGVKGYHVTVVSHNPHCVVEYAKYIRIK